MRAVRLLITLLACSALALAAASGASAHAPTPLTAAEFHQLQLAQSRIRSLESAHEHDLRRAATVCTRLRKVSRLITAVRAGCLDLISLGGDDRRLNDRATHCGIDPSSEQALLRCLVPAVQRYHRDAESFYRAETRVDRLARDRGFDSRCVAVIGDSPRNIAAEGRLAADLGAAVHALENQNPDALATLSSQIEATVRSIRPGPSSLSLCPHS